MDLLSRSRNYLNSHPNVLLIPFLSFLTGFTIGIRRGARASSLRFLAENAHRAPRTVKGWYFYSKTKNYHVLRGALQSGTRDGAKIASVGVAWVTLEQVCEQVEYLKEAREVVAGVGSASIFLLYARLNWLMSRRVLGMGALAGGLVGSFRWLREKYPPQRPMQQQKPEVETPSTPIMASTKP